MAAELCRRIYETCCRLADEGILPTFDRLMLEFDQPAIKACWWNSTRPDRRRVGRRPIPEPLLNELIKNLEEKEIERRRPAQIVALRQGGLDDRQQDAIVSRHRPTRTRPARHFQAHGRVRMPGTGKT